MTGVISILFSNLLHFCHKIVLIKKIKWSLNCS